MAQRFDPGTFWTRRQADARYQFKPQPAVAPTGLSVVGTGLSGAGAAFVTLNLNPPPTPFWANTTQYVVAFEFIFTQSGVSTTYTVPFAGTGPYTVTPVAANALYTITARTLDYTGQVSTDSASVIATTPPSVGTVAARIITAVPVSAGCQITLDALNSEVSFAYYGLFRGRGAGAPVQVMTFTNAEIPTQVVVDQSIPVTANDYYYFVQSFDLSGNFARSNIVSGLALAVTGTPTVVEPDLLGPPGAYATANPDGTIDFFFLANTSDTSPGLSGYRIRRRVTGTTSWEILSILPAIPAQPSSGDVVDYKDSTAISGVSYDYTVAAIDNSGNESSFDTTNFATVVALDTTAPAAPASITFSGQPGAVRISWPGVATAVVYEVSWRFYQSGVDLRQPQWVPAILITSAQYDIEDLFDPATGLAMTRDTLANQFQVQVRAQDAAGNWSGFTQATADFPSLVGFGSPTSILANPLGVAPATTTDPGIVNDGTVLLSWQAPSIPNLAGYYIERLTAETGDWKLIAIVGDGTSGPKTYKVTGLDNGIQYRFRVRTYDTGGDTSHYNYIHNPGFENGLTGWTAGISATIVTTNTNNNSVGACRADYLANLRTTVPGITPNREYTISAYMRQDSIIPGGYGQLGVDWYDSGAALLRSDVQGLLTLSNPNYQRLVFQAQSPTNAASCVVHLYGSQASPSVPVLWDSVQMEEGFTASSFGDGKTTLIPVTDVTGPQDYGASLAATGGLGQINLRWKNPSLSVVDYFQSVFEVWRNQVSPNPSDTNWTMISEVPGQNNAANNGYDDFDPAEAVNETWFYQVRARDRFGNEGPYLHGIAGGTVLTATSRTLNDISPIVDSSVPPNQPDMTTASIFVNDDGSIKLTWNNQPTLDLVGYNIYRKRHTESTFVGLTSIHSTPGNGSVSFVDSSVQILETYDYTVSAVNRSSLESTYDTVHFLTAQSTDTRIPGVPTNPTGKGGIGLVACAWGPSSSIGVHDYEFQFSLDNGATWTTSIIVTGVIFSLPFISAEDISQLLFRVRALSSSHSAFSAWVTDTSIDRSTYIPVDTGPPHPVTSLVATPNSNSQVVLTWTRSVSQDVNHYQIDMAIITDPAVAPLSSDWSFFQNTPSNSIGATLNGLKPYVLSGIYYAFRVWSVDNSTLLSTTAPEVDNVQVLVDSTPPATPAGFDAAMYPDPSPATSVHAVLSWSPSPEIDLLQYEVQYYISDSVGDPLGPVNIFPVSRDTPNTVINSLLASPTVYAAAVRAVDINQNRSPFTDPILLAARSSTASGPDAQPGVSVGWNGTHPVVTIGQAGSPGTPYSPSAYFLYFQVHRAFVHAVSSANRTTDPANPANGLGHIVFASSHNYTVGQTAYLYSFGVHNSFNGYWKIVSVPSNTQIVISMVGLPGPVSTFGPEGKATAEGGVLVNTASSPYTDTSIGHAGFAGQEYAYSARAYNNGNFLSAASNPFGTLVIP